MKTATRILTLAITLASFVAPVVSAREDGNGPSQKIQYVGPDSAPERSVRAQGVFGAAAQDTIYYGGTFWNADSSRWQALKDSVWTFDSGVGSNFNHSDPLVDPYKETYLHAFMEGWVGRDVTYSSLTYFRRLETSDFAGGAVCVGTPAGLGGTASLHCGILPSEVASACYQFQGYGDDWNICTSQDFLYAVPGNVSFSYDYTNASEDNYDFTRVYVNGILVASYTGIVSGFDSHTLDQSTYFPGGFGTYTFEFCFTSDGAWSDQDGAYVSNCGAFTVDDISISGGGINHSASFEGGDDGWTVATNQGAGGDWSNIVDISSLPAPLTFCQCTLQDSVLVFEDASAGGHNSAQNNLAISPWIDLKADTLQGSPGKFIEVQAYSELPLLNYVFVQYEVQWYPDYSCVAPRVSDFTSTGFVYYYGGVPTCTTSKDNPTRVDFSSIVPVGTEQLRIAVGVVNWCGNYGNCSGLTNSTPWFDNIRVGIYGNPDAPIISASSVDLPQDSFPENGTLDLTAPGRLDCNNWQGGLWEYSSLGDTLVVTGASGGGEVNVVFAVSPGPGINTNRLSTWLLSHPSEGSWLGLEWYSARMDTSERGGSVTVDTWMTTYHEDDPNFSGFDTDIDMTDMDPLGQYNRLANDIFPDDLFTPGTRVLIYYKTRFTAGTSWYVHPDTAGGNYFESEVLPSSIDTTGAFNSVLYVDHGRPTQTRVETALSNVLSGPSPNFEGLGYDRYDVQAATANQGSFGRPAGAEWGANLTQAMGYDVIIYNSGNLGGFAMNRPDADVLLPFLAVDPTVGKSLYLTGSTLAENMISAGETPYELLVNYMGASFACDTYRDLDCPGGTPVDTTSCVDLDPVTGGHFGGGLGMAASGNGCPQQRSFDVLGVSTDPGLVGDPRGNLTYSTPLKGTVSFGSISNHGKNEATFKSVIDGAALAFLRDSTDCFSGVTAIETRLTAVLDWFNVTPMFVDTDGDFVPDATDACPGDIPAAAEVDMDFDGCPDATSSFRFVKFRRWKNMPVHYETDPLGDPRIGNGSDYSELQAAFDAWASVPGSQISGGDDGTHAGLTLAVSGDARNSITFSDPDGWLPGVLAITPTATVIADSLINDHWYRPGEIVDADILFNTQFHFSTPTHPTPPGDYDLRSVAVHEFGHFFGLSHSSIPDVTMFYAVSRGISAQSLEEDDICMVSRGYVDGYSANLTLEGKVFRGDGSTPIVGAGVFAIGDVTGDTLQFTPTHTDGTYRFYDVSENFRVWVQPIDGGPEVQGLQASAINSELAGVVETDFLPEWWDQASENNADSGSGFLVTVPTLVTNADIVINVDSTPPIVTTTTPTHLDTGVAATTAITTKFDERLDRDYFTGNPDIAFRNIDADSGITVSAALLQRDSLVVVTPQSPLQYLTNYRLTVGPDVRDISGNPMSAPVVVEFQTGSRPPVSLTSVTPGTLPVGGTLVLFGTGFEPDASQDTVFFSGGVWANPYAATLDRMFVTVPEGAVTGTVTAKVDTSSSALSLTIVPPKEIPTGNSLGVAALGGDPTKISIRADGAFAYVSTDQGIAAVDALPTSGSFLAVTPIPVTGGCVDAIALPDGLRVLAGGANPPRLYEIDSATGSGTFNTITGTAELLDPPLGMAGFPGGAEIVIIYSTRAVLHSTESGSLLGRELREWSSSDFNFLGDVTVAVTGGEIYASTDDGKIAVLGMAPGEGVVALLGGGVNPREMAGLPDGTGMIAVDENGVLRSFGSRGPLLQTVAPGGGFRGFSISPEGSFAYAGNLVTNVLGVLDLQGSSIQEVATINVGVDPVDVTTGSAGRYIYVATANGDYLEVYDTQSGPRISSVYPTAGGSNSLVTLTGSGFDPVPANNQVTLGLVPHTPVAVNSAGTAMIIRQEGSVTEGPVMVSSGILSSNVYPYRVVNRPDPANFAVARGFVTQGLEPERMIMSPAGEFLIVLHSDGSMTAMRTNSASTDFHRPVQHLTSLETTLIGSGDMFITPDGKKLYVHDANNESITIFDLDEKAAIPLELRGSVIDGVGVANVVDATLAGTPDGTRLLAVDHGLETVFEVSVQSDSIIAAMSGFLVPTAVAVHLQGHLAYVATSGDSVQVLDIDPGSGFYRTVIATVPLPGTLDRTLELTPAPDGSKMIALTRSTDATPQYAIHAMGTDSGGGGYHTVTGTQSVGSGPVPVTMVANHSGTVLYTIDTNGLEQKAFDLDAFTPIPGGPIAVGSLDAASDVVISLDDARLYTDGSGDEIIVTDLTPVEGLSFVAGTTQVGVEGNPLSAPIVARVETSGDAALLEGSAVVLSSEVSGGDFGFGDAVLFSAADAQGLVRFNYTIGPGSGTDSLQAETAAGVETLIFTAVGDTSLAPPEIVSVVPQTGTFPGVSTSIAVEFSKPINPSTVDNTTFIVRPQGGSAIPGYFTLANGQRRVVFKPITVLDYSTVYEIEITIGLLDWSTNPLSNPGLFSFESAPSPPLSAAAVQNPSARQGNRVVISGTGFSSVLSENIVMFGEFAAVASEADPSAIVAYVPQAVPAGSTPLQVISDADSSNILNFEVFPPVVQKVNEVTSSVSVPRGGLGIIVIPDGSRAYMTSPRSNAVVPIVIGTGSSETPIPVGLYPYELTVSPTGDRLYVTNFFSNDISVIDTNPLSGTFQKVIASIPVGLNPAGIVGHPDGRTIYCVNHGDSTLSVVDTDSSSASTYSARQSITTNSSSKSITVTPDGGRIIVGTSYGLLLIEADDTGARKSITTNSASKSITVSPDGGMALVLTADNRLLLIDIIPGSPTEGQARKSITTNSASKSITVSPDGGFAYLTLVFGVLQTFQVSRSGEQAALAGGFDASGSPYSITLVDSVQVGENPTGMAFDPSGSGQLLVVNSGDATVSVVQATAPVGIAEEPAAPPIPLTPRLYTTMPNPFTRSTRIRYDLVEASPVNITVFDLQGRVVKVVEDALDRPAGTHEAVWDGRNQNGQKVSSGVYFYRLMTPRYQKARKVVLLR